MDPTTLVLIAALGVAATGFAMHPRSHEVVWGTAGVLLWAVFGLGATNVEIFDAGVVHVRSYYPVALLAAGIVALNIYVMLYGSIRLFKPDDEEEAEDLERGPL